MRLEIFRTLWGCPHGWLQAIDEVREAGFDGVEASLPPEFGPDGYLHYLPFTNAPIADLWALNRWIAQEERRHSQRFLES